MRFHSTFAAAAVVLVVASTGCSKNHFEPPPSIDTPSGPQANLIVVHASVDTPNLNLTITGAGDAADAGSPTFADVPYADARTSIALSPRAYTLTIDELKPTGDGSMAPTKTLVPNSALTLAVNTQTTVFLVNKNASPPAAFPVTVTTPLDTGVAAGEAKIAIADVAALAAGSYKVYLTAPGESLSAAAADSNAIVATLSYEKFFDPSVATPNFLLPAASNPYRVRVTAAATSAASADASAALVLFDSGVDTPVTIGSGSTTLLALLDSVRPAKSPFMLGIYANSGNGKTIVDPRFSTGKFANLATDAGTLTVAFTGESLPSFPLSFGATHYICAPTGGANVSFSSSAGVISDFAAVAAFNGSDESFIPTGLEEGGATGSAPRSTLISVDDDRPRATEARIKFINAAPGSVTADDPDGSLNLYVSTASSGVAQADIEAGSIQASAFIADPDAADGSIIPSPVPFGATATFPDANILVDTEPTDASGYLQPYLELPPETYDIFVTIPNADGTQTVLIKETGLAFAAGNVLTLIARDPVAPAKTGTLVELDNRACP